MVKNRDSDYINDQVVVIYDKVVPLYIVKGEKNFLIDSGVAFKAEESYTKIKHILEEEDDCRSTEIQTLLLTHTHFDHIGGASYLQGKFDFEVICSQRGVRVLEKDKVVKAIDRLNQDYKEMAHSQSEIKFEKLERVGGVAKGDKIMVDGYSYFEVIETPGHTGCSISYFLHPWGILFPGDSTGIIVESGAIEPIFLSSYTDYERSLIHMLSLDIQALALPHNMYIKGKKNVVQHLERSLKRTRRYRGEIMERLEKGWDISRIAGDIYEWEFSRPTLLGPREAVMGHLETMIKVVQKECMQVSTES